jgi:hypothetical protein
MHISISIPKLVMDPPLAHFRSKCLTRSVSKRTRNLSAESNTLILGYVLDRWRIMNSLVQLSGWILVSIGQQCARKHEASHWVKEINAHSFSNPNAFSVVDILPQDEYFTARYFIDHGIISLAQARSIQSRDISRRRLQLHFDNSRCQIAQVVQE